MALRLDRINRTWLMLFVAIVMALAAAWLTKKYLEVREQRIVGVLGVIGTTRLN